MDDNQKLVGIIVFVNNTTSNGFYKLDKFNTSNIIYV